MIRPRKPSNVLEMSGAFRKNPKRAIGRTNEPIPSGEIGEPPEHLNERERELWHEFVRECPQGVAKNSDRFALMALCKIAYKIESGGFDLTAADYAMLKTYLQQFGMTPVSRSMVQVKQDDNGNEFSEI